MSAWTAKTSPTSSAAAANRCSPRTSACPPGAAAAPPACAARRSPRWPRCRPTSTRGSSSGAARGPRSETIAALARALRLTLDERDHLFHLAGYEPPARAIRSDHVSPPLLRVLDRLDTPAQVTSDLAVTLVQNELAVALLGEQTELRRARAAASSTAGSPTPAERAPLPGGGPRAALAHLRRRPARRPRPRLGATPKRASWSSCCWPRAPSSPDSGTSTRSPSAATPTSASSTRRSACSSSTARSSPPRTRPSA